MWFAAPSYSILLSKILAGETRKPQFEERPSLLMDVPALIKKKRDALALPREEIFAFIEGYSSGDVPDYQASALLMAIFFRGLDLRETADLTEAMIRSRRVLDLSEFPQSKIDKHSTGGVGDKTSLIVGPVAAAGGLLVPMIARRDLNGGIPAAYLRFHPQQEIG